MRNTLTYVYYNLKDRVVKKNIAKKYQAITSYGGIKEIYRPRTYAGKTFLGAEALQKEIASMISERKPFMIARLGTSELSCIKAFDFRMENVYEGNISVLERNSGFFPHDIELGFEFTDLMIECMKECDLHVTECMRLEEYYVRKYMRKCKYIGHMKNIEPQRIPQKPWTLALKGKKVLIIHPFADTIKKQFERREELYPGTDILPEFELKTVLAVQTIAGTKDERFADWFEALNYMYEEAMKLDFDIAIIGCGAYGYPLAAKLKKAGKMAIHMGGVTQGLFGIRSKRFDEAEDYETIRNFYNQYWCYPSVNETPIGFKNVESGCYWATEEENK